jgi:hypothetical protein
VENLPFAIAKLADANAQGILTFARDWGRLGYVAIGHTYPEQAGDPIPWIRQQGKQLQFCVSVVEGLQHADEHQLAEAIRVYVGALKSYRGAVEGIWNVTLWDEAINQYGPPRAARWMLEIVLTEHLKRIWRCFELHEDDSPSVRWQYFAMVDVAYLHVAQHAERRSRIEHCAECEAPFKQEHGLQRFCVKGPFRSESPCSYRHRYRKLKS